MRDAGHHPCVVQLFLLRRFYPMASRQLSLAKAKQALRKYIGTGPSRDEIEVIFNQLCSEHNDRTLAIFGASMVERSIELSLWTKFRYLNLEERRRLFGPEAPLSSFSSKIKIAYAMELCDRNISKELNLIREIRNAFAHSSKLLNFETKEVVDLCKFIKFDESEIIGFCFPVEQKSELSRRKYLGLIVRLLKHFSEFIRDWNVTHIRPAAKQ